MTKSKAIKARRTLRKHQAECVIKLSEAAIADADGGREYRELVAAMATGSGKSVACMVLLGRLIDLGIIRSAIVACPQNQIKGSFFGDQETFTYDGKDFSSPGGSYMDGVRVSSGIRDLVNRNLVSGGLGRMARPVKVVCHQYLNLGLDELKNVVGDSKNVLRNMALVVDEFHRAGGPVGKKKGTLLYDFIKAWKAAGGLVIKASATVDRHDDGATMTGKEDIDYVMYSKNLASLMIEGMAPGKFESLMVQAWDRGGTTDDGDAGDFGIPPAEAARAVAVLMVGQWREMGRPKLMIQLRSGSSADNRVFLSAILTAVARAVHEDERHLGGRKKVYDATDVCLDEKDEEGKIVKEFQYEFPDVLKNKKDGDYASFSEVLEREKERVFDGYVDEDGEEAVGYGGSEYAVIVGIQRLGEGTDWPLCSVVFRLSMPTSLPFMRQLIGRASRDKSKIHGYPDRWKNKFCCVMFVAKIDRPERTHSRQILLTSVFLSSVSMEVESWSIFRKLHSFMERFPTFSRSQGGGSSQPGPSDEEMQVARAARAAAIWILEKDPDSDRKNWGVINMTVAVGKSMGFKIDRRAAAQAQFEAVMAVNSAAEEAFGVEVGKRIEENGDLTDSDLNECIESLLKVFQGTQVEIGYGKMARQHILAMTGEDMDDNAKEVKKKVRLREVNLLRVMADVERKAAERRKTNGKPLCQEDWEKLLKTDRFKEFDLAMSAPNGARGLQNVPGGARKYVFDKYWSKPGRAGRWTDKAHREVIPGPEGAFFKKAVMLVRASAQNREFVNRVLGEDVLLAEKVGGTRDVAAAVGLVRARVASGVGREDAVEEALRQDEKARAKKSA